LATSLIAAWLAEYVFALHAVEGKIYQTTEAHYFLLPTIHHHLRGDMDFLRACQARRRIQF